MRKLLSIIVLLLYIVPLLIFPVPSSAALTCDITTTPTPVILATKTIRITINPTVGLAAGDYYVKLNGNFLGQQTGIFIKQREDGFSNLLPETFHFDGSKSLTIPYDINHDANINTDDGNFAVGDYSIGLYLNKSATAMCTYGFKVTESSSYGSCQIKLTKDPMFYSDPLSITINGFSDNKPASGFHVEVHQGANPSDNGKLFETIKDHPDLVNSTYDFDGKKLSEGNYTIYIKRGCDLRNLGEPCDSKTPLCAQSFCVGTPTASNGNSCGATSVLFTPQHIIFDGQGNPIRVADIPCANGQIDNISGNCKSVPTGFGFNIGTDAPAFAASIMGLLLAVGGAILLLIIIITGYRLMASQGDPEKVKAAREQLTGAIAGLIFMIFSIAILALIGVNVLHIPGIK